MTRQTARRDSPARAARRVADRVDPSDVAIVVPVGGAAPAWERCARSLARLDPAPGEIVAVIDGADGDLAARAVQIGARVVALDESGGPARARNRGVEQTGRDIVLFVDSDVEVPRRLVARVARCFTAEPTLSAVFGSYDDTPGHRGMFSQYRNLLHHFVHQQGQEAASTFWAGCGALRRRAFLEVGGFDERYAEPSVEDIELGSRLRRAGHTIRLVKDLQVKHLKRWRLPDLLATDLWRRAVPWAQLMARERQTVNDLNVRTRDRVSVLLAYVSLIALLAAWIWPPALAVGGAAVVALAALNAHLFRFFVRTRGLRFALTAIPLHVAYLVVCGLGVALGLGQHLFGRHRDRVRSSQR